MTTIKVYDPNNNNSIEIGNNGEIEDDQLTLTGL